MHRQIVAFLASLFLATTVTSANVPLAIEEASASKNATRHTDGSTTYHAGVGTLSWRMPDDLEPGFYHIRFDANAARLPTEWVTPSEMEYEPYRFANSLDERRRPYHTAHSFVRNTNEWREIPTFLHKLLGSPIKLSARQSDRPLELKPGGRLYMESRWSFSLVGNVELIRAAEVGAVDLATSSDVRWHMFDTSLPVRFVSELRTLDGKPFTGTLRIRWLDAIAGFVDEQTHEVRLAEGTSQQMQLQPSRTLPFGAYSVHVELFDSDKHRITHQYRNFTYAPRFDDVASLPDNWPFAWHTRGEPHIPPVGFKWVRIFDSWREMEPEQGKYNWESVEKKIEQARAGGHKVLWIMGSTPRWASPKKDNPTSPRDGKIPYYGFPPDDLKLVENFVGAFWEKFAPGGDTSVVGAVEVMNEPNVKHGTEITFQQYADYTKAVYQATKRVAPSAKVVGVSMSGGQHSWWSDGVLDAGTAKYIDAASAHFYEINAPVGAVSVQTKATQLRQALDRNGATSAEIWNTEAGVGSYGRFGDVIPDEHELELRARSSPRFDPRFPEKVGWKWRTTNELVSAGYMVRAAFQQIELGVGPIFWFKLDANNASWVHDPGPGGNVVPKTAIVSQAIMSHLYKRYGMSGVEKVQIESPDPDYTLFAHRFRGPEGRMTVLYAHPKKGTFIITDEVAAKSIGGFARVGEYTTTTLDGQPLPPPPPSTKELFKTSIPDLAPGAVVMDILARKQTPVGAGDAIGVAQLPVYIIEPSPGAPAWPATR